MGGILEKTKSKTFADFLAPIPEETFFAEHYQRKPLHIKGGADKFATLLPWADFNRVMSLNAYWDDKNLKLYRDQKPIPIQDYCASAELFGEEAMRADPKKVTSLFADGATIVANYADTLTSSLNDTGKLLEETLFGYALANIYCSRFDRQGFKSHFDYHEVFAIQTEGRKTWRVYEGRIDNPVRHPKFSNRPPGFDDAAKKGVLMEVTTEPGDILYIPRGQYHDATASAEASLHVTYGVQPLCGLDILGGLMERTLDDPLFRADLPTQRSGEHALAAHLKSLGDKISGIFHEPGVAAAILAAQRERRLARGGYDFPNHASDANTNGAAPTFSLNYSYKD